MIALDHPIIRAIITACLTAAILALWRLYIWPMPGRIRDHLSRTIQEVVRAETKEIKAELHPNGGSSLRDAVDKLADGQHQLSSTLRFITHKQRAMLGFHDENRGWFETDSNGALVWLSSQVLRWVGRSMTELQEDRWRTIIVPEMRDAAMAWWKATWSAGSYGDMEQYYIAPDGGKIRVLVHATPVFDDDHKLIAHVGTITRVDKIESER